MGITPAYAGKRKWNYHTTIKHGDHPRVCGEKRPPPRYSGICTGITPAYAGKSQRLGAGPCADRDHPRVCGEKIFRHFAGWKNWGSPPRMRGKGGSKPERKQYAGITPAYAGKSD